MPTTAVKKHSNTILTIYPFNKAIEIRTDAEW